MLESEIIDSNENGAQESPLKSNGGSEDEFKQRLLNKKIERKRAEESALALNNRVLLLEQEERKVLKKIDETRKKAQEIMELKNRNLQAAREKEEKRKREEEELEARRQELKEGKEIQTSNIQTKKQSVKDRLKNDVSQMKKELEAHQEKASSIKAEEYLRNSQSYKSIADNEKSLKEKKKQMEVSQVLQISSCRFQWVSTESFVLVYAWD